MKKNIANRAQTNASIVSVRRESGRFRKIRNGTSGCFERSSVTTKALSRATASASSPIVWVDPQPALSASTSA